MQHVEAEGGAAGEAGDGHVSAVLGRDGLHRGGTVLYCTVLHCTGHCDIICVQVMVSRLYRDLRLGSIAGGADEIMLGIICKLAEMGPTKN